MVGGSRQQPACLRAQQAARARLPADQPGLPAPGDPPAAGFRSGPGGGVGGCHLAAPGSLAC